ncbi:TWiK family of potassium channels protein 18-like [Copidosoma floridanum]|uniref:TWiK family of potassium channels protein 18-like n=1 Tax=Copidosoma floridanum TaxID=29053 RepID=UPI0006C952B5|nr:TWiK family of potassium channels protein 18-like [Copidosoma floridanum]
MSSRNSSTKRVRKLPPRPKINLPAAGQFHFPQTPMGFVATPYGQTSVPLTPASGQPPTIVFTNRTSEYVLDYIRSFKDWTSDWTKSGLSVGEKSAFWIYEKVSSWSKRWFTHIFLFFVLFLYSVLGAFLFIYIEGKHENAVQQDIVKERDEMIEKIRDLWNDKELAEDSEKWKDSAKNHLMLYEDKLHQFLKKLNFQNRPDSVNWAFWNAVIYCSTIYTTIGRY